MKRSEFFKIILGAFGLLAFSKHLIADETPIKHTGPRYWVDHYEDGTTLTSVPHPMIDPVRCKLMEDLNAHKIQYYPYKEQLIYWFKTESGKEMWAYYPINHQLPLSEKYKSKPITGTSLEEKSWPKRE